jgi:hypothetical protein
VQLTYSARRSSNRHASPPVLTGSVIEPPQVGPSPPVFSKHHPTPGRS